MLKFFCNGCGKEIWKEMKLNIVRNLKELNECCFCASCMMKEVMKSSS